MFRMDWLCATRLMDQRNLGLVGLEAIALLLRKRGKRESWFGGAHRGGIPVPLSPSQVEEWHARGERGKQFEVMG